MIKIMTLDTGDHLRRTTDRLQEWIAPLRHAAVDVLCCQSIGRDLDGEEDLPRTLAHSLGLTSSCFAAHRQQPMVGSPQPTRVSGLAILTGTGVWMLNSGSLPLPGDQEGEDGIVQFALIRKNGASVLVLNLQLASSIPRQRAQLLTLFSHPLLKERYGAVVLGADRPTGLSAKELQTIMARSNYCLHRKQQPAAFDQGLLCLLAAREQATVTVTLMNPFPLQPQHPLAPLETARFSLQGPTIEFEVDRILPDKKTRPYLPLSFREQWLGCKEKYPAFAA